MKYTISHLIFLSVLLPGYKAFSQQERNNNTDSINTRIIYEQDIVTGSCVPIAVGAYVKVWYLANKGKRIAQPLGRTDFNKRKTFLESRLGGITDTQLLFFKRPLPFPLILFRRHKVLSFDTVPLASVIKIRSFTSTAVGAYKNASMLPTMNFMPTSINGIPIAFLLPSVTGVVFTGVSDLMYPMHPVKTADAKYRLTIEHIPFDSALYNELNGVNIDHAKEWNIDAYKRWEKVNTRLYCFQRNALLRDNFNKVILSFTYGTRYFPGFAQGPRDNKTNVDITDSKAEFGLVSERFVNPKDRVGIELLMESVKAHVAMNYDASSMKLGAGSILSFYSFYKYGLGGLFGKKYRNSLEKRIAGYNIHSTDPEEQAAIYSLVKKLVAEPKPYLMLGLGAINTNLFRVRVGQQGTSVSTAEYKQKKLALEGGAGISSRMSKHLFVDMAFKYTWTTKYDPPLGGINRLV